MQKTIYYSDELNDEFSEAKIVSKAINENYKYERNGLWNLCSFVWQNILSIPIKVGYLKFKLHHKYVGKKEAKAFVKKYKGGIFIYGNHTLDFADTFIPSQIFYPKRNFLIVNGENVSIKGIGWLVEMLGAIPIPSFLRDKEEIEKEEKNKSKEKEKRKEDTTNGLKAIHNFMSAIEHKINKGYTVSIYPEAHIWPYYTKIRNFKDVSFKYPIKYDVPSFCFTNTYQKRGKNGFRVVTFIDGPFYPNKELSSKKEMQKDLRDRIYGTMVNRSKESNIELIKYIKK